MSRLLLVRHGQASFHASDYDCLSDTGVEQACRLGRWMAARGIKPDAVIVGPRRRHADSATHAARAAGGGWPDPQVEPGFDEHGVDLFTREHPQVAGALFGSGSFDAAWQRETDPTRRLRGFLSLFQRVLEAWVLGTLKHAEVEPFEAFCRRVDAAFDRATSGSPGRTVLVFSSVGPISCLAGNAMALEPLQAIRQGWQLRNGSLTQVLFSAGRVTLDSFNETGHLDESSLLTFM